MIVDADSSPLRYLIVLLQQDLLPTFSARHGYHRPCSMSCPRRKHPRLYGSSPESTSVLRVRALEAKGLLTVSAELDAGERAALALACELGADLVLMDDAAGRREAALLRLRMTGTLGVLRLAAERGLIDVPVLAGWTAPGIRFLR